MTPDRDVLIVGGGLVGLSLAAQLSRQSCSVTVLEAGEPFAQPQEPGLRVSAISPSSSALLHQLGAWQRVPEASRSSFARMRVWDAEAAPFSDRALEFAGVDFGAHPLGHIVHNDMLQWALYEAAQEAGAVVTFGAPVEDVAIEADGVRVFCGDDQYTTRLLVGADGARSRIRELCDIDCVRKSYEQLGLVCNIRTQKPHEQTAWQRFLATGPVALLPLSNGECSIVWSLNQALAAELMEVDDHEFAQALLEACDAVLGDLEITSRRASFPLSLMRAERYTAPRVALVGDAAHVIHPLAGQGVNLGFGDVLELSQALADGQGRGDRVGDQLALRKYERARKFENRKMQLTVDGLQRLFSSEYGWLRQGRSVGMGLLNQWPTLKGRLAREALGTVR